MFILPIIFYANKAKARSHIKMYFWDVAPDFLQRFNPNNLVKANVGEIMTKYIIEFQILR